MRTTTLLSLLLSLCASHGAVTLDVRTGTIYDVLDDGVSRRFGGKTNALPVSFSPNGGLLPGGATNCVVSSEAGAYIFYTLDGSTPDTGSSMVGHGGTVAVTSPGVIKALSWRSDAYTVPSVVATSNPFTNAPSTPPGDFTLVETNISTSGHDWRIIGNNDARKILYGRYTATVTTNVGRFEFLLGILAGSPSANLTGKIYAGSTSAPDTNALLATSAAISTTTLAPVGSSNYTAFTFASPAQQTNAATYWLGVEIDTVTGYSAYVGAWGDDAYVANGTLQGTNIITADDFASRRPNFRTYSTP